IEIRVGRIGSEGRTESKWISGVHGIVAEKTIESAVRSVGARLGDNVDGRAGGCSQVGAVIAAIDLKFLYVVLAYGKANAAAIARGLATVDGDAVAAAIAAVERQPALRCLLDSEILVTRESSGIRYTRREQSKRKVIAPINRQVGNILLRDRVGLAASFRFHHRRLVGHLDYRRHL